MVCGVLVPWTQTRLGSDDRRRSASAVTISRTEAHGARELRHELRTEDSVDGLCSRLRGETAARPPRCPRSRAGAGWRELHRWRRESGRAGATMMTSGFPWCLVCDRLLPGASTLIRACWSGLRLLQRTIRLARRFRRGRTTEPKCARSIVSRRNTANGRLPAATPGREHPVDDDAGDGLHRLDRALARVRRAVDRAASVVQSPPRPRSRRRSVHAKTLAGARASRATGSDERAVAHPTTSA